MKAKPSVDLKGFDWAKLLASLPDILQILANLFGRDKVEGAINEFKGR